MSTTPTDQLYPMRHTWSRNIENNHYDTDTSHIKYNKIIRYNNIITSDWCKILFGFVLILYYIVSVSVNIYCTLLLFDIVEYLRNKKMYWYIVILHLKIFIMFVDGIINVGNLYNEYKKSQKKKA